MHNLGVITNLVTLKKLFRVFCVSSVADSFAFLVGRVTHYFSLVFHSISFGFAFGFHGIALGFSSIFFLAVARSEREGHSGYGEEEYFFHGAGWKEVLIVSDLNT